MSVKGMVETGAMILLGIVALKAFGGLQGITEFVGGLGDFLGFGGNGGNGNGKTITESTEDIIKDVIAQGESEIVIREEEEREPLPASVLYWNPVGTVIETLTQQPERREVTIKPVEREEPIVFEGEEIIPVKPSPFKAPVELTVEEAVYKSGGTPYYLEPEPEKYRSGR